MKFFISILIVAIAFVSCNNGPDNPNIETARRGKFKMVADESFKPIIDSQIEVFQSAYPEVKIDVTYATEADCYKAWDSDSATRLIITTRTFSEEDGKFYRKKFLGGFMSEKVALDAVAVILNPAAAETKLTMEDLKDAMLGKSKFGYRAVFDGLKETSNLRFMLDSVLKTDTVPPTVQGLQSNKAVIDFVAKNKTAIGFIGVNWIGSGDPDDLQFTSNVKIASIQCQNNCPSYAYKKPYQANIATKQYPLVRGLYYTVKNDQGGVATNFAKWLEQERGQLIFKRAFLVGTKQQTFVKQVDITR
jgi:phosphate transport system substrate-binding protein